MDQNLNAGSAPKRAIRHSWSADHHMKSVDWPKLLAQLEDSWIEIYLFLFFRDKDASQFVYDHSANFLKHSNLYK